MNVPFQTETRASRRKLSSQSDLQNTYAFSQNSSLSISDRKRKRLSSFSQSQPTQLLQDIPIYSELSILGESKSAVETQKSQIFVEIPKKSSFDLSQYSSLPASVYSRTPLGPKDTNIQLSQTVSDYIRKPDQKISWGCVRKWQKSQPNDHTSKSSLYCGAFRDRANRTQVAQVPCATCVLGVVALPPNLSQPSLLIATRGCD
jgi:hypothetical protein